MYESPILITSICDQIASEVMKNEEEYIVQSVQRMGIDVNKDELIKALYYDRGQYDKGYIDGRIAVKEEIVKCCDCKYKAEGQGYCYKHGIWLHRMEFCSEGERKKDG